MSHIAADHPCAPARARPSGRGALLAIVGAGRLGTALADALRAGGRDVIGPLGREEGPGDAGAVLLCVPDAEIASAAGRLAPGTLVGHCSGATGLDVLAGHDAFALHPLMTVTHAGARFEGAGAAVAGTTPQALAFARTLATELGMVPFEISDEDRAAYHAAASIASNFLVVVEAAAERVAATAGLDRAALLPLARAALENWARLGGAGALTGPVARGDHETVARQRDALADRAPELVALFDALCEGARDLARREVPA